MRFFIIADVYSLAARRRTTSLPCLLPYGTLSEAIVYPSGLFDSKTRGSHGIRFPAIRPFIVFDFRPGSGFSFLQRRDRKSVV